MTDDTKRKRAELLDKLWIRTAERLLDAVNGDEMPSGSVIGEARKFLVDQGWTFSRAPSLSSTFALLGIANLPTFDDPPEDPKLIEGQAKLQQTIVDEAKVLQEIAAFEDEGDTDSK